MAAWDIKSEVVCPDTWQSHDLGNYKHRITFIIQNQYWEFFFSKLFSPYQINVMPVFEIICTFKFLHKHIQDFTTHNYPWLKHIFRHFDFMQRKQKNFCFQGFSINYLLSKPD